MLNISKDFSQMRHFIDISNVAVKWLLCSDLVSLTYFRSTCPKVFCKKGVLRNFTKFTGKHWCQSLFFKKVAGLRPFFIEHLWWLLLYVIYSKQENWKIENINVYEAGDFISEIFWGSTSGVLKKILVLNLFSNSQDDVLVKLTTI